MCKGSRAGSGLGVFVCKCSYLQDMCIHKRFCDIEMISSRDKLGLHNGYLVNNYDIYICFARLVGCIEEDRLEGGAGSSRVAV